jgi:Tol biopolymer transport system component
MNTFACRRPDAVLFCLRILALGVFLWIAENCPAVDKVISNRNPALPFPSGSNGDSVDPSVSKEGRFVLFSSSASDLVPYDTGALALDVFLHDRTSNTTVLVSANLNGTGGGNGSSISAQASTNGRYVVFQSDATDLVSGDTNAAGDIFVRDLQSGSNILVSVAVNGGCANGSSTNAVITPDGRWIAFVSSATNLVSGDTNKIPDLFVRDLVNGTTTWVTAGATGLSSVVTSPAITPDGRYVTFFSTAKGMVAGVTSSSRGEVYLCDLVSNTMTWVSSNASATASTLLNLNFVPSFHPEISDDGRYVTYKTGWTNGLVFLGVSGGGGPAVIVSLYDSVSNTTTILTTNGYPPWAFNDDVYGPEMTSDGRFIAFAEKKITATATNPIVQLWDRQTGTSVAVSVDLTGAVLTNASAHTPVVSPDGRYVAFLSDATNLVSNVVSNGIHIYRRDVQTSTTVLVDTDTNGLGSVDQFGTIPSMSSSGDSIVFASLDGGLVSSDTNKVSDIFLWDATTGRNRLISTRDPLAVRQAGDLLSSLGQLSISGDGSLAAFASFADDLVTNDLNGDSDVFIRDLVLDKTILVSVGTGGSAATGGGSLSPFLSADGRYVIFLSGATNLVFNDTNGVTDLFRKDLQTGTVVLVSVDSNGANIGVGGASWPAASLDGRYVAFLCRTNSTGNQGLFWRDINSGVTRLVSGNPHLTRPISISSDGGRLAYFDGQARLYVWDSTLLSNIYTNTASLLNSAAISPTGNRLLYQTTTQLFVAYPDGNSNQLLAASSVRIKGSSQWSGDGRYVAFVTAAPLFAADSNGTNDVYLFDLQTSTLSLLSVNLSGTASASGASDYPVVSADGRLVAFRSFSTDNAGGIVRPPSLILFDRLTGSNSVVVTGTTSDRISWISHPVFATNNAKLSFQNWDSGLVAGDLNRAGDAFATDLNVLSMADSDADGIPDWWTMQYFGHPTGQAGDLSRAQDDADGDGMNNLQEYLAGTDPTNGDSALVLHISLNGSANTNVLLSWTAAAGRSYQIQSNGDLGNLNWQTLPGSVTVIGNQGSFNVQAGSSPGYFRLVSGN